MTDILAQVESHLTIWGLADAEQRAAEIDRIYTPDVEVIGPEGTVQGRTELNRHVGRLQDHFGGMSFVISSEVLAHNGYAFYAWDQQDEQGKRTANGWDVLQFDGDHIGRVVMFIAGFDLLQVPKHD